MRTPSLRTFGRFFGDGFAMEKPWRTRIHFHPPQLHLYVCSAVVCYFFWNTHFFWMEQKIVVCDGIVPLSISRHYIIIIGFILLKVVVEGNQG